MTPTPEQTALLETFSREIVNGGDGAVKKGKHPNKSIIKEGEVEVNLPKHVNYERQAVEVPSGHTGFARGSVASGTVKTPKR